MADIHMENDSKNDVQTTVWTVHGKMLYITLIVQNPHNRLVEVRLNTKSTARFDTIRNLVHTYLSSSFDRICLPSTLQGWEDIPVLSTSVEHIIVSESSCPSSSLPMEEISLQIHVYQPSDGGDDEEFSNGAKDGEGQEVMAASACELPCIAWDGLWDSLVYSDNIKLKLLEYVTSFLYSGVQ
jgi:pachytene checkpoint protein 2